MKLTCDGCCLFYPVTLVCQQTVFLKPVTAGDKLLLQDLQMIPYFQAHLPLMCLSFHFFKNVLKQSV
jgi:hypothetical protein